MLAALAPASLARLRFPLGELRKPQVRELARAAGLPVADKRESQDLCFLAGTGKSAFLARHGGVRERPGAIVDRAGRTVGRHRGQHLFTVGQRKGLGVAARGAALRARQGPRRQHGHRRHARASSRRREVAVRDAVLHRPEARRRPRQAALPHEAARRAGFEPAPAAGSRWSSRSRSTAPRPGQLACLMRGDVIVGHGVIDSLAR